MVRGLGPAVHRWEAELVAAGIGITIVPSLGVGAETSRRGAPVTPDDQARNSVSVTALASDALAQMLVADVHRRGIPARCGPTSRRASS